MMCREFADRLPEWAAGRLAPAAHARVDSHLAACPACRAEAEAWRAAATAVNAHVDARTGALGLPRWRDPEARRVAVPGVPAILGGAPALAAGDGWRAALTRRRGPLLALSALAVAAAAAVYVARWEPARRSAVAPAAGSMDARAGAAPYRSAPDRSVSGRAAPTVVVRAPTAVRRVGRAPTSTAPRLAVGARTPRAVPAGSGRTSPSPDADAPPPTAAATQGAVAPTAPELGHGGPREPGDRDGPDDVTSPAPPTPTTADLPSPVAPSPTAPPSTEPSPSPAPPGPPVAVVAGGVTGPDGLARAEVRIVAVPFDASLGPVEGGTDASGAFSLTLQPGRWSIRAEAGAYLLAWPGDRAAPLDAAPVEAVAGSTQRIDFVLRTAPGGAIRGRVVDRAGVPVSGALVVAAEPDGERGGYTRFVASAFTSADGTYELAVLSGGWLVAATADWRAPALVWWGGGDLITIDRLSGHRKPAAEGIDFRLPE